MTSSCISDLSPQPSPPKGRGGIRTQQVNYMNNKCDRTVSRNFHLREKVGVSAQAWQDFPSLSRLRAREGVRAAVMILTGLAAATLASAQAPPPPGGAQFQSGVPPPPPPPEGPQLAGCTDSEGKLLPISADLTMAVQATGPFSVQVTWSGPPTVYRLTTAGLDVNVDTNAALAAPVIGTSPSTGRTLPGRTPPGGGAIAPPPPPASAGNGAYSLTRPQFPVVPDAVYGFKLEATLADGRIICSMANARTPAAPPILPLQSTFVAPNDIRLALQVPPYVQGLNVYRENYTADGRYQPGRRLVFQEAAQNPAGGSATKQVNPGLPPLPSNMNYALPLAYDLSVEVIWSDGVGRVSRSAEPIRVNGPLPLFGWADLHTHPMSHLAFGGKIFHGAPDVGSLVPALSIPPKDPLGRSDCVVRPNLRASNINEALADDSPTHGDPAQSVCGDGLRKAAIWVMESMHGSLPQPGRRLGAPIFDAWPRSNDVTHQKMWVEWIRRAWEGNLRVLVALSHNSRTLAELVKGRCDDPAHPCLIPTDDLRSSDLQIMEIKDFVARNASFMEVALSSADVYRIVRANKIAVVLGVEIDNIGNFSVRKPPSPQQITDELTRLWDQGVRYIFPVHVTDNVFGGTAPYENLFSVANLAETGHWWEVECAGTQPYPNDDIGFKMWNVEEIPDPFSRVIPKDAPLPRAPLGCAHRNIRGLDQKLGVFAVKEMMRRGFIIDVDHMSHRTVEDVLGIALAIPDGGYPLMSGHSGIRDPQHFKAENSRTESQLDRIGCLGGMFGLGTDHAEPRNWAAQYQEALRIISTKNTGCPYKELGRGAVALGTDINSMVETPKSLMDGSDLADRNLNVYASTVSGATRPPMGPSSTPSAPGAQPWDFRTHGVAHYGMYADFLKAIWSFPMDHNRQMHVSGQQLVEGHLERNADNFWRMWVKVEQQKTQVK